MSSAQARRIPVDEVPAPTLGIPSDGPSMATEPFAVEDNDDASKETGPAPWRALLYFTTKSHIPVFISGILTSIVAGAKSPGQSFIVGKIFNGFIQFAAGRIDSHDLMNAQRPLIFYLVALAGASWVLQALEFAIWISFGELQAKSTRDRLFRSLLKKDVEWFEMRKNGIGALLPRLQAQIRDLQLATSQPLGTVFTLLSTAILSLVQSLIYSWKLALVTLASAPFIMAFVIWMGNSMAYSLENQSDKLAEAQKFSTNALSAIETVKCFNGQDHELEKYMQRVREAAGWYYKVANRSALQMSSVALLMIVMFVQGFYYGGILIKAGELSAADVTTCFLSAVGAFAALQNILPQMIVLEKGRAAGMTLRAVLARVEGSSNAEAGCGHQKPAVCRGDIQLKGVNFAYPSRADHLALRDVSMYIPGGEITFLIGKSGSGKSTIGQLLLRFYAASEGSVSIDGTGLEDLDVTWLRSQITLVEQTSLLFDDTIFRNIAFGRRDHDKVTREEISNVLEFALLQLMINDLPNGIDTVVGFRGGAMSGGQRQRMALARARLRDTPILVLDESTSALDHITRTLIMEAIRKWRSDRTTVIITHDISQILPDDYAFVLEHGEVVQQGYRKHMQRLFGTPFQKFLPAGQRARSTPSDVEKALPRMDYAHSLSSFRTDSMAPTDSMLESVEVLPELPRFTPMNRISFSPHMYQGSPLMGVSSIMQSGNGFASTWPFSTSTNSPQSEPHKVITEHETRETSLSAHENSDLEKLVERAGEAATVTRAHDLDTRRERTPVDSRTTKADQTTFLKSIMRRRPIASKEELLTTTSSAPSTFVGILSTLWPNIKWPQRMVLIIGFWGSTMHAAVTPVFSFILSKLIATYATPRTSAQKALTYSMALLGVAVVDAVFVYIYRMLLEYVGQHWVDAVRARALQHVLDQPRDFFDKEENSVSRITESLDRNAEEMRNLLGRFAGMMWCAAVMILVSLGWALVAQWKMTLVALATIPYVWGVARAFARISEKWEGHSNDASESAGAIFNEVFMNIKTVRSLTLEHHFLSKYLAATEGALRVGLKRALSAGFFYGMSDSAGLFCTALTFYIGVVAVQNGADVANVIQVFTMLLFTVSNVGAILEYMPQIGVAKDTATRILRLAQLPTDSHEDLGDTRVVTIGDIEFSNLDFSYPSRPGLLVLSDINLVIKPGTCTALVGSSGSGKSTIANLLLNLYTTATKPSLVRDQISDLAFAGRDIKTIHTPSLRSLITVVPQTPTLFAATVADNILYGLPAHSPHVTSAACTTAARRAGIHDFVVSLPYGYDTLIGEGGTGLSGGQMQRIAIARAIARQPAVLILDEATSALDVESANLVRDTVKQLVRERARSLTVIIITHHRDMMEFAEQIVVMDRGRIVEEGSFDDLLAANGALTNLLSGGECDKDGSKLDQ